MLDCIAANRLNAYISIKLTQLGLDIGREACSSNLELILQKAKEVGNFVRIDMESSRYTEPTIRIFEDQLKDYLEHVGIVIQSYLYRSEEDVRRLSTYGCNIRLCKGAYMESADVAFPKKRDVDRNYIKLLELLLSSPAYTAIATHDSRMINHARRFVADKKIPAPSTSFKCSTESGGSTSWKSPARATRCASTSPTAGIGPRITCAASPSVPRMCCS